MRRITIIELPEGGWVRDDGDDQCPIYPSAASALKACQRGSREIAEVTGGIDVLVIDWHPKTRVGRMVVEALQS